MKLDERTAIPIPREGKRDNVDQSVNFDNQDRSSEGHHDHKLSQHFNLSKSPPRFDADQSDQSSRYTHIPSRSAPALTAQTTDDYYFNKQDPISIEGIPLNEREKKWWNELRETAGKLADFASFVHRTGKIPPRNDLEWARSNFHLFAENMSALQMVLGVLRGEGPRFPDAGLNTLKMANSSRYGKRLMSQSPSLEGGSSKTLSTTFPPPLNRHVSYDKVILPDRSMRPSTSLNALTGDRSDVPYNKTTPSTYDQRYIQRFETGSERLDIEHNRWRERNAESNRTKEAGRLDMLPETNFARDRTSSSNARTFAAPPTDEQDYSSEKVGPSRVGSTAPLPPPPLTSPYGNYPRHLNNSPRSGYSAHERPRVSETDSFVQRASMPSQHHINNPVGLPVPQPPLHNPRQTFAERRASSDFEGTQHPTTYSPPYNSKSDDRYGYRPPSDHFSTQHGSRFPNDHYRDEYREGNQYDHSYVSGDESGSGSVGFRPSKYRKRSRAPAPGSCVSCGVRDTPEWRRGPNGARTLCNACGLHFSKLLRRKKQEQGNDSATVSVEELRSSLKLPGNGSTGQISPSF